MKKAFAVFMLFVFILGTAVGSVADSVRVHDSGDAYLFSANGDIWGRAKAGETYELLEESDAWYKIQLENGTVGWIATDTAEIVKEEPENSDNPPAPAEISEPSSAPEVERELDLKTAIPFYAGEGLVNDIRSVLVNKKRIAAYISNVALDRQSFALSMTILRVFYDSYEVHIVPGSLAVNGMPITGINDQELIMHLDSSEYVLNAWNDVWSFAMPLARYGIQADQVEWIEFEYEIGMNGSGQETESIRGKAQFVPKVLDLTFDVHESQAISEAHILFESVYEGEARPLLADRNGLKIWMDNVRNPDEYNNSYMNLTIENTLGVGWTVDICCPDGSRVNIPYINTAENIGSLNMPGKSTVQVFARYPASVTRGQTKKLVFSLELNNTVAPYLSFNTGWITLYADGVGSRIVSYQAEEASSTIQAAAPNLPQSCSTLFLDQNGLSAYIASVYSGKRNGIPTIELNIMFRNHYHKIYEISFKPEISNVKINGIAYRDEEPGYDYGVIASSDCLVPFGILASDEPLPQIDDIKTIEFSILAKTDDGLLVFSIDHVTVTVDPEMNRGAAPPAEVRGRGYVWHDDGSLAFRFGEEYDIVNEFSGGLAVACKVLDAENYQYGVIDTEGNVVIPMQYEYILNDYDNGMFRVDQNGKRGVIDRNGNVLIEPQYGYMSSFLNGLASVRDVDTELYYFVDQNNEKVEALGEWPMAGLFGDKYILARNEYGKKMVMDREGNVVIAPEWDSIYRNAMNGYLTLEKDGLYTFADRDFNVLSEPVFDEVFSFGENGLTVVREQGKYRMIDDALNTILDLGEYTLVDWIQEDGIALCFLGGEVEAESRVLMGDHLECHLIDEKGHRILTIKDNDNTSIHYYPGLGVAFWKNNGDGYGNYGMIDLQGNILIPFRLGSSIDLKYTGEGDLFLLNGHMWDDSYSENTIVLYSVSRGEIALLEVDRKGFSVEELLRDMEIHEGLMIANPKVYVGAY